MTEYNWGLMPSIKWIPGYEGRYACTTDGKIASYKNKIPIWLSGFKYLVRTNYLFVSLFHPITHKRRPKTIHSLVLETWVGFKPKDMVCCHINGNPQCNHIYNLRYDTQRGNLWDSCKKNRGTFFDKRSGKYVVRLWYGYYNSQEEAAIAFNEAATKLFGDKARLNNIKEG